MVRQCAYYLSDNGASKHSAFMVSVRVIWQVLIANVAGLAHLCCLRNDARTLSEWVAGYLGCSCAASRRCVQHDKKKSCHAAQKEDACSMTKKKRCHAPQEEDACSMTRRRGAVKHRKKMHAA